MPPQTVRDEYDETHGKGPPKGIELVLEPAREAAREEAREEAREAALEEARAAAREEARASARAARAAAAAAQAQDSMPNPPVHASAPALPGPLDQQVPNLFGEPSHSNTVRSAPSGPPVEPPNQPTVSLYGKRGLDNLRQGNPPKRPCTAARIHRAPEGNHDPDDFEGVDASESLEPFENDGNSKASEDNQYLENLTDAQLAELLQNQENERATFFPQQQSLQTAPSMSPEEIDKQYAIALQIQMDNDLKNSSVSTSQNSEAHSAEVAEGPENSSVSTSQGSRARSTKLATVPENNSVSTSQGSEARPAKRAKVLKNSSTSHPQEPEAPPTEPAEADQENQQDRLELQTEYWSRYIINELKVFLRNAKQKVGGKKAELIDRLIAYCTSNPAALKILFEEAVAEKPEDLKEARQVDSWDQTQPLPQRPVDESMEQPPEDTLWRSILQTIDDLKEDAEFKKRYNRFMEIIARIAELERARAARKVKTETERKAAPTPPPEDPDSSDGDDSGEPPRSDNEEDSEQEEEQESENEDVPLWKAKTQKKYKDTSTWARGISNARPIYYIEDMFRHLINRTLAKKERKEALMGLTERPLKIGTMCSGTECPIIFLEHAEEILSHLGINLRHEHLFSFEKAGFKQNYISRNFPNVQVFNDVVEMIGQMVSPIMATTSFDTKERVPEGLDILVAGFVCSDFSSMNRRPLTLSQAGESGDTFHGILFYCMTGRPKLLLLENSPKAPWTNKDVREEFVLRWQRYGPQPETPKEQEAWAKLTKKQKDARRGPGGLFAAPTEAKINNLQEIGKLDWGIDKKFADIDYLTLSMKVDSRNYYLPESRNRTYLLGIDLRQFNDGKGFENNEERELVATKAREKLDEWKKMVVALKFPATVSADALIRYNRDELTESKVRNEDTTISVQQELGVSGHAKKGWANSRAKQLKYRADLQLGNKRTLTNWADSGYWNLPDHWKVFPRLLQRICEVLEINHLRCIVRGYDDRSYSRLRDVTQDPHFDKDSLAAGIIGCIRPTTVTFATSAGRVLTGRELLLLMGFPVNRMDLSHLSEREIIDLTGNAMASTAIGVTMLSALVACADLFEKDAHDGDDASSEDETETQPASVIQNDDYDLAVSNSVDRTAVLLPLTLADAKMFARNTVALCHCENPRDITAKKQFMKCKSCGHTTCLEHWGNPKHNSRKMPADIIEARQSPVEFEKRIRLALPKSISFANGSPNNTFEDTLDLIIANNIEKVDGEFLRGILEVCCKALSVEHTLRSVERSDVWDVNYESSYGRVQLQLSGDRVEWLLYAKPPSKTPALDEVRVHLQQFPIARLRPSEDDITKGSWEIWLPKTTELMAEVTFRGKLHESFEAHTGLVKHQGTFVLDKCVLEVPENDEIGRDIGGTYQLKVDCGHAFNSLHVRKPAPGDGSEPLYLLFNQQPQYDHPSTFRFVVTEDARRLGYGVYRQAFASFPPTFRQPRATKQADGSLVPFVEAPINEAEAPPKGPEASILNARDGSLLPAVAAEMPPNTPFPPEKQPVVLTVKGSWIPFEDLSIKVGTAVSFIDYKKLPAALPDLPQDAKCCGSTQKIFECEAVIPNDGPHLGRVGEWTIINHRNQVMFYQHHLYVLEAGLVIDGHVENGDLAGLDVWHDISRHRPYRCTGCAPQIPGVEWAFQPKAESDDTGTFKPFHDPAKLAVYVSAMKHRPEPIQALFKVDDLFGSKLLSYYVRIDPVSLMHQASALLSPNADGGDITTSWRLVTNNRFVPLPVLQPLVIPSTRNCAQETQPSYLKGTDYELRPEQLRSLKWQLQQERGPAEEVATLTEEEVVEYALKIGYRLLGKATRKVVKRGGILAHAVGFGKTVVLLAMMALQKSRDARYPIEEPHPEEKPRTPGLIYIKATLIAVPTRLVTQWAGEVTKFMPKGTVVLKIPSKNKWQDKSIRELKEADVIIVGFSAWDGDDHLQRLAKIAGTCPPHKNASKRQKDEWYKDAVDGVRRNVTLLMDNPDDHKVFLDAVAAATAGNTAAAQSRSVPRISKRTSGQRYQMGKAKIPGETPFEPLDPKFFGDGQAKEPKSKPKKSDTKHANQVKFFSEEDLKNVPKGAKVMDKMKNTCPEMFSFVRFIIDEFPEMSTDVFRVAVSTERANTWLPCGTMGKESTEQVQSTAELMGINLGVLDYNSLPKEVLRRLLADMTTQEKVLAYPPTPSPFWVQRRNRVTQAFLTRFAVEDIANPGEITVKVHFKPIVQPAAERATYLELEQLVAANSMQLPTLDAKHCGDADRQLHSIVKDCKDGAEGLLWRSSHFNHSICRTSDKHRFHVYPPGTTAPKTTCEYIMNLRRSHLKLFLEPKFKSLLDIARFIWASKNDFHEQFSAFLKGVDTVLDDAELLREIRSIIIENFYGKSAKTPNHSTWVDVQEIPNINRCGKLERSDFLPGAPLDTKKSIEAKGHYMRTLVLMLNATILDFARCTRSARLAKVIESLEKNLGLRCDVCNTQSARSIYAKIYVLCGHYVCPNCVTRDRCAVATCRLPALDYQVVESAEFWYVSKQPQPSGQIYKYPVWTPVMNAARSCYDDMAAGPHRPVLHSAIRHRPVSNYGQKIEDLIQAIRQVNDAEKILLFVQKQIAIDEIIHALNNQNIESAYLAPDDYKTLNEFQMGKGKAGKAKVFILKFGSDSGCNLTVANHIFFFAPFWTSGSYAQQLYEISMKQAIARAVRYGQKKEVHIRHFLTVRTFEIDLFEEREGKVLDLHADGTPYLRDADPNEQDWRTPFSSNIRKQVLGRNLR